MGKENALKILDLAAKGENVVILSNHQTEADPQVWQLFCADGDGDGDYFR